jgi:hypothetical protein
VDLIDLITNFYGKTWFPKNSFIWIFFLRSRIIIWGLSHSTLSAWNPQSPLVYLVSTSHLLTLSCKWYCFHELFLDPDQGELTLHCFCTALHPESNTVTHNHLSHSTDKWNHSLLLEYGSRDGEYSLFLIKWFNEKMNKMRIQHINQYICLY